ncbi:hypothetical protein [Chelativorans salis]|uniref:Spore coat protein U domain-containing protein n=1 Tax=Chelativorans salis TaxID=2978478 RepID=A0ABT2LL12_9HYPH|nr:hypothetical protein [Chelativorans sp. EGI FJ00035]MCT7375255.1 hypothetical protein [Chelativorans sp. EGI FJ00035]
MMRPLTKPLFGAAFLAAIAIQPANAETVIFNGLITSTCLINVGTPGTLVASADYTELSSTEAGGTSGTVTILTTGAGYEVSTDSPSAFATAPAGGGDSVTFASSYSANGVTSLTDVVGSLASPLGLGLTNLSVDLMATKSTGTFPAGDYMAEVTVTCE